MPDAETAAAPTTTAATEPTTVLTTPSTPPTEKPAEGKGGTEPAAKPDEKPTEPAAPEKYELKAPDETPLKPDEVNAIEAYAKEHKLSQAAAQKLLEKTHQDRVGYIESQKEFLKEQVTAWGKALTTDKEIAGKTGTEYSENVELAKKAVGRFGSPELIKQLNATGFGNHPELVRMMMRVGKAMREDAFHAGGSGKGNTKDAATLFYPNQKE
jgi:hypothetical protein